jgi:glucose/arabinose dehydrogenase
LHEAAATDEETTMRDARRRMGGRAGVVTLLLLAVTTLGCGQIAFDAVDQAALLAVDYAPVPEIVAPPGFRTVRIAEGLTYPSSLAFDDAGTLYVLESHTVPVPGMKPRIFRVRGREIEPLELAGEHAPSGEAAVGLAFHDGWLYLSHEEEDGSWAISRVRRQGGDVEAVLRGLPPLGDHWINYLAFDRRGDLYFGIGSATNSGVVSSHDAVNAKWLEKRPQARDLPCSDLVLTGATFRDDNALTDEEGDEATTGAFQAYGQAGATRAPAARWCSSSIYRLPRGGGQPQLVAWGFRNPVALAFDGGDLLVGMHGADVRGTRPVKDDADAIYRVREGAWYGWPDYGADLQPVTAAKYQPPAKYFAPGHQSLGFVIDHAASGLKLADRRLLLATTEPHAALGGMVVVPAGRRAGPLRAWAGKLLLSEMGDFKPHTDPDTADQRAGFQVEVIDLQTGRRETFLRNRGDGDPKPATQLDLENGLERPVDVKIGPDGFVYVLDYGAWEPTADAAKVLPKTGKVFRVEPLPRGTTP